MWIHRATGGGVSTAIRTTAQPAPGACFGVVLRLCPELVARSEETVALHDLMRARFGKIWHSWRRRGWNCWMYARALPSSYADTRTWGAQVPRLCLVLSVALHALHFSKGEADPAAKEAGFDFTSLAPAAKGHGCDFPTSRKVSGGEEDRRICVACCFHATPNIRSFPSLSRSQFQR